MLRGILTTLGRECAAEQPTARTSGTVDVMIMELCSSGGIYCGYIILQMKYGR